MTARLSAALEPGAAPRPMADELTARAREFLASPHLRDAITHSAARNLEFRSALDGRFRWLMRSALRSDLMVTAFFRTGPTGEIPAAEIFTYLAGRGWPALATARRVFEQAQSAGLLDIVRPSAGWRGASLRPTSALTEALRKRAAVDIEAAAMVAPDMAGCAARLADDRYFARFLAGLMSLQLAQRNARPGPPPAIRQFFDREAGLPSLYDLFLSQPAPRARSLEAAPFSRLRLAQRFEVSRAHIISIYRRAERDGLVSFPSPDRIVFSPELSRQWDLHFAGTYAYIRYCALRARNDLDAEAERPATM